MWYHKSKAAWCRAENQSHKLSFISSHSVQGSFRHVSVIQSQSEATFTHLCSVILIWKFSLAFLDALMYKAGPGAWIHGVRSSPQREDCSEKEKSRRLSIIWQQPVAWWLSSCQVLIFLNSGPVTATLSWEVPSIQILLLHWQSEKNKINSTAKSSGREERFGLHPFCTRSICAEKTLWKNKNKLLNVLFAPPFHKSGYA